MEQFIKDNRDTLIEALDNHISEIGLLIECVDDDAEEYVFLNSRRNALLRRLIKHIRDFS